MKNWVRHLKEMEKVVYDKKFAKENPDLEVYYVERGVKKEDELRYDLTTMPSRMLGQEFVRTKGNRNSNDFQELYTVLEGEAIFLMQKTKGEIVKDIKAIRAQKGDWVLVPPKYAVIMINPSKKTLKTGNWVSEKNKNIYQELEKKQGACYYYTSQGWLKNKNYSKVPKLRFEKPLKEKPKNLNFLN